MTKDQTLEAEIQDEPAEGALPEAELEEEQELEAAADVIEGEIVTETEVEAAADQEEPDELTTLHQQLEATQAQADEYLDDLRRERAAFQNYKKRQENERAELRKMVKANILGPILPILDDMERALEAIPDEQAEQPWVEGVLLIQRKLRTALEGHGVVAIEAEPGESFDPFVHEAVTNEEHDEFESGQIIAVVQKGYQIGERVLRPAMVRVAR